MNKRFVIFSFLVPMLLVFAACAAIPESTVANSTGLTFIHLNDTYRVGAVEDASRGGFGRVVTVIRDLQREGREVRILHGGDFLYPSLESQLWDGLQMVDAMNFMDDLAPMYVTIGNHESDRRSGEHLINAVREARFDWLGDNFHFNSGNADTDAALQSTFTFTAGGKTIGVFALTMHADDGGNERDYLPVDQDYLGVARRAIEALEAQEVDAIIGLTHLHMGQDLQLAMLHKEHPKLAFIAGGHEHEPQYSASSIASAAVIKGASNARVIWQIDLEFDAKGLPVVTPTQLPMDESVAVDAEYALLDKKWRDKMLEIFPFLEARVGVAALPLDVTEETLRNKENAWGNFIVDQMLGAFGEPAADFAFINSGTLRIDDHIADDITFEDIARTFGFSSFLRYMTMSGSEFRLMMEAGYRGTGGSKGYFPQVAGFRVCVDRSRESGSRIVSLQVPAGDGWQEIDADAEYRVVIPDFLYSGGDGYQVPAGRAASRPGSELKYLVLDGIVQAQARGEKVGVAVDPAQPRTELLAQADARCFSGNSPSR